MRSKFTVKFSGNNTRALILIGYNVFLNATQKLKQRFKTFWQGSIQIYIAYLNALKMCLSKLDVQLAIARMASWS